MKDSKTLTYFFVANCSDEPHPFPLLPLLMFYKSSIEYLMGETYRFKFNYLPLSWFTNKRLKVKY